jgi:hypothetical protein
VRATCCILVRMFSLAGARRYVFTSLKCPSPSEISFVFEVWSYIQRKMPYFEWNIFRFWNVVIYSTQNVLLRVKYLSFSKCFHILNEKCRPSNETSFVFEVWSYTPRKMPFFELKIFRFWSVVIYSTQNALLRVKYLSFLKCGNILNEKCPPSNEISFVFEMWSYTQRKMTFFELNIFHFWSVVIYSKQNDLIRVKYLSLSKCDHILNAKCPYSSEISFVFEVWSYTQRKMPFF